MQTTGFSTPKTSRSSVTTHEDVYIQFQVCIHGMCWEAGPVLSSGAVELPEALRKQLSDLGLDPDVGLFVQQKALKAQAREEKAAKALAKGSALAVGECDPCNFEETCTWSR